MVRAVAHRIAALPTQLQFIVQTRLASTSSESSDRSAPHVQFPFPTHPRPTPHQIFHLPFSASQQDIKQRYYALVRLHHPDSPSCRRHTPSPAERHARFQAIAAAYDTLTTGFKPKPHSHSHHYDQPLNDELEMRKRAYYRHHSRMHNRQAEYAYHREWHWGPEGQASPDDRWKDRAIIAIGLMAIAAGLTPAFFVWPHVSQQRHLAAVSNLSQAKKEARVIHEARLSSDKNEPKSEPESGDEELDESGD